MASLKTNGHIDTVPILNNDYEEIEIPVPWGHVAGKWWGPRNEQPILALHGWQDNAGTWDTLAPLLPRGTALLGIDLPGHGKSSHYPPGMSYYIFWDGVPLIRRIVKHFKWEKVTLLGHSLGGALSFMYAAAFPDDVDRYVSLDIAGPSVRDTPKVVSQTGEAIDRHIVAGCKVALDQGRYTYRLDKVLAVIREVLKYEKLTEDSLPSYEYEEMINIVFDAYRGSVTRESCQRLMIRGMAPAPAHFKKTGLHFSRDVRLKTSLLAMMSIEQVLEYATRIKCKVLNIRAVPGMDWDQPQYYQLVLDKISESAEKLVRVEVNGTHHVHLNDPEKVVPIIVDFLRL